LFHHAILFPEACWPRLVTLNELLIREGVKMSKSKGNVIPTATIPETYSADLVRLCLVSIADLNSAVDWREKEVEMVKKKLLSFWNSIKKDIEAGEPADDVALSFASRWIIAATSFMVLRTTEAAHQFSYRKYVTQAFFEHLNRVEEYKAMVLDVHERRKVLWDVIDTWSRVLAPIIPHIAEEIWARMKKTGYISIATFPQYNELYAETLQQKAFLDEVIDDISNIQAAIKRDAESVYIYLPAAWKYELYEVVYGLDDLSIKNVMKQARESAHLRSHLKEVAQVATELARSVSRDSTSVSNLSLKDEMEVLCATREYLSQKFGKEVHIFAETDPVYDPANRARRALPGKPAIYLE